jgi:endonuclease-3
VEDGLVQRTPKEMLLLAHHWLILHGRYTCKARAPECWRCVAFQPCGYRGKAAIRNRSAQQAEVAGEGEGA